MKRVRVTRDAEHDLDGRLYIARDSPDAGNRLLEELAACFVLIGSDPKIGHRRDELRPDLRSPPVGNYVKPESCT